MKEIKFRAYFPNKAEMKIVATQNIYEGNNTYLYLSPMPGSNYESIKLMQYTGLKDKNGKEIYEGDIIRDNDSFLWEVYWEDGSFYAKGGEYELSEHLIEFIPDWCEVIGNIFENLELLEGET